MHDAAALRRHVYFRGDMNEVFEKMAWSENWFSLNIMRLEVKLEQMQTFAVFPPADRNCSCYGKYNLT